MKTYYAVLRVRVESDGRLQPLWYSVSDEASWMQQTVVNHEYTIAICALLAATIEAACVEFKVQLPWFAPLLKDAEPEAWFTEQVTQAEQEER